MCVWRTLACPSCASIPIPACCPHLLLLSILARTPAPLPPDPTGGPGFESPRPTEANGWIKTALNSFRVVLMDQRGTGRSSQITVKNLAKFKDAKEQAEYLSYFRWGHATVLAAHHNRHEQLLSHTVVLGRYHSDQCTCSRWHPLSRSCCFLVGRPPTARLLYGNAGRTA